MKSALRRNMAKHALLVAIAATLVAGCATAKPTDRVDFAAPPGPFGVTDEAGATASAGVRGLTLAGPAGPVAAATPAGAGEETGPAGGRSVAVGTSAGGPGARGGPPAPSRWTPYRSYTFRPDGDGILLSDGHKAEEVSYHVQQHPSSTVALDGTNDRRVGAVRRALLDVGVPSAKITTGAFGDAEVRRRGGVLVLVSE
jgi:hypothetical protein